MHDCASLMVQGTTSDAGKTTLVAGLARLLARGGCRVAPFKPQNMALNSAVTADGGEIGRAQALQALAAGVAPHTDFNPVLLKPATDIGAQVIIHGKVMSTLSAKDYHHYKPTAMAAVMESWGRLTAAYDCVLIEGAGSPAEINLRDGDIANMGFAIAAGVPVVLAGDIDRGGVIASLVGTHAVLARDERARIHGFLINKFRGEARLFDSGLTAITQMTGWPALGVVPWLPQAAWLPAEDALDLDDRAARVGARVIAVPVLPRIANFDDLDPLAMEPGVKLVFVRPGEPIPAAADVIIIPGTKSTIGDLAFLRALGWDIDIRAHVRRGGHVLGLCGGYQMLGRTISDPAGLDGTAGDIDGLGLLDIVTTMQGDKSTTLACGIHRATGLAVEGYEIHLGRSEGPDCARPMLTIGDRHDGATSVDGRVQGTYLHGLFGRDDFRAAWLQQIGVASTLAYEQRVEAALDALADHLERHLDISALLAIAQRRRAAGVSAA